MKLFLLLSLLLATKQAHGQSSVCEICGAGLVITNYDTQVNIPGQANMPTCSELQTAGLEGQIPDGQCTIVPSFVFDPCGCVVAGDAPTEAPLGPQTELPADVNPPCDICGEGLKVTLFDVIVNLSGVDITPTCAEFEQGGLDGMVPASQCPLAPLLVSSLCGCAEAPPPTTPSAPPSPSPTSAQETAKPTAENGCYICGDAFSKITVFDAFVDITGTTMTCAELEQMALNGGIPVNQCALVPLLVSRDCGCEGGSLSTLGPTPTPTDDPDICYVCGEGFTVGQKSATLQLPGETLTCGELEDRGLEGDFSLGDCLVIPEAINATCECIVEPDFKFEFPNPVCNVCGEGMMVTAPDATINLPDFSVSCADLSLRAFDGEVAESDCAVFPGLLVDLCGCMEAPPPTSSPTCTPGREGEGCRHDDDPDPEETPSPMMPSPTSDTVPSQAPATSPVDTTPPSSPAPTIQDSGGCTSGTALFGSNTGTGNQVEFLYEAITTPQTVNSALRGILTATIEPAVSASLLSGLFGGLCSRRLQARRRLEVLGLSTQPDDELQSGVQCVTWESNLNRCTVVKGIFTLYSEPGSDISEKRQAAIDRIHTSMDNGAFSSLDSRLVSVNFRTEALPEEDSTPDPFNLTPKTEPATVPVWAWVLIGVGIAMLNACICFFVYRRQRMAANDGSKGDDDGHGYGDDDGNYEGGADYQDQPDGGYQDQPDGGYQEADDDDNPYEQPDTYQSTGLSQTSPVQDSSSKAGSASRQSQPSFADPNANMMNSIGNL